MVKEACELFNMHVKQLFRVLTDRKYLSGGDKKGTGPRTRGKRRKSVPSAGATKKAKTEEENEDDDDDDNNNTTRQKVKDKLH